MSIDKIICSIFYESKLSNEHVRLQAVIGTNKLLWVFWHCIFTEYGMKVTDLVSSNYKLM